MSYVLPPPPQAKLPVAGSSDYFAVRRIFCVGRNYAAHAREMGNDPDREPPFFFTKPADVAIATPCTVPYPPLTEDLHFEIELVIAIGKGGADIAASKVHEHIWGASVGIDLTRRDLQAEAKKAGRPWDWAKAFDQSAPVAPIVPMSDVGSLEDARIWLAANGQTRQEANISDLIWSVDELVATLSEGITLAPGDLIMTGTPAGVGPCGVNDVLTGGVDGIATLQVTIGQRT